MTLTFDSDGGSTFLEGSQQKRLLSQPGLLLVEAQAMFPGIVAPF